MHGITPDLPLDSFVGKEFNLIGLGRFQIQLHASGTGSLLVEAHWELRDANGALIDQAQDHKTRRAYRLHEVIDVPVVDLQVTPPKSFTFSFEDGHTLTVYDDEQYEAFSIHLDGEPSLYI